MWLQAFREDRTLIAAADYIADALGQRFVESVPLNMERAWSESHPKCPLICLLSPGADPTKLIEVSVTQVMQSVVLLIIVSAVYVKDLTLHFLLDDLPDNVQSLQ